MTVCRYYLQGNCRFGNRCRFEHSNYSPDYSYKRNDYDYQDRSSRQYDSNVSYYPQRDYIEHVNYAPKYSDRRNDYSYQDRNSYQYDSHVSYNLQRDDANSWYRQQHYNYSEQYSSDKAHSKKQHSKNQLYRHESNDNVWHQNSEYERSASNYYSNNPEISYKEFTSGANMMGRKVSVSAYPIDTSSLKRSAPSTFKDSNPLSKQDAFYDLNMSEMNKFFAEKKSELKSSTASISIDKSSKSKVPPNFKDSSLSKQGSCDLNMNETNMFLAEVMKKDAEEWELSNIWSFSSYCPIPVGVIDIGSRSSFPGFYDISPEELKYEAYKASKNNSLSSYVAVVEEALLDVKRKRDELKEPSVALMSIIKDFRKGKYSSFDCNVDGKDILSKFSKDASQTEMFVDKIQGQPSITASTFSFKTTLETDSIVKASAASFSFKLPSSELDSKQTGTDDTDSLYTPLEQLSLEDKEQFLSSTFTLGKIPSVPPPKSLC